MRPESKTTGAAAFLLAAVLGVGACGSGSANEPGFSLETATVERGGLESSVEATGTVEAIKVLEVRSQASGEILNMPVELGDEVEQGALLLEIDPRDEVNEVEQGRADLEQAEAQLGVAESRLARMRALRDSGVVTAEELETAIVEHANARSSHVRAQTRLELAQEQRADATVRAPISGTIVEKGVEEGQVVTGTRDLTGGTVLLRMADLSEVQVRTLVDESEIGGVGPGLPASITVEAYPDRTFRGEVLQVEPRATVEQNVTMFAVLTRIPNESRLLKPGMNADVEIVLGRREGVLKLSNSAVKMPDEARQLVSALGMDAGLLDQRVEAGDEGASPSRGSAGAASDEGDRVLPGPERLRAMSTEERRELLRSSSPEERRELMRRLRSGGPGEASASGAATGPRPAFVFVRDDQGVLTLKPVRVGLSSWEETEIVAGLEEGDAVVEVPLALVQQSELLERIRRRSGVPGMRN